MVSVENVTQKKTKKGKKSKIISFDEEIITKDKAEKLLESSKTSDSLKHSLKSKDKKKKVKKEKPIKSEKQELDVTNGEKKQKPKKQKKSLDTTGDEKKQKKRKHAEAETEEANEDEIDADEKEAANTPEGEKPESIRAKKRRKHQELLKDKKLKHELDSQQKSLNYLSKWKHSRTEWKFEKLRQIWLQQNMYDSAKIPDEFWETLLEYLSGSKGQIRKVLLKSALDLIEKSDGKEEDNENSTEQTVVDIDNSIELKRARDVIQNLQE